MEIDQIKELVTWMKKQKVQHFKVNGLEVAFSGMAMVENSEDPDVDSKGPQTSGGSSPQEAEDIYKDPMLYASTG